MNVLNNISDFCALGLRPCRANSCLSTSVEIPLHSENALPCSSVAPGFFFSCFPCFPPVSDLDCISRSLFAVADFLMPLKLKWAALIAVFMGWVYISTKAWLCFASVPALPVITKSFPIKQNPFSEELVSSPLPGPVLACDNTDKSMHGFSHAKADVGGGGEEVTRLRSAVFLCQSVPPEECNVFSRC